MSRKNRRSATYIPLDLTPSDLDTQPITASQRHKRDARYRESDRDRAERQAQARVNRGIDWSCCIVPGCGRAIGMMDIHVPQRVDMRDSTLELPICSTHAGVIWNQLVQFRTRDPKFIEAIADVNERLTARDERRTEETKARNRANVTHGHIYFIRLGELVKVGWTRDLWGRVKSYGASAVLLACYPASRADETNLHRQLTPARAKGREWYEDGAIITKFVAEALAKHGDPPTFEDLWTQPKAVVATKRATRARR